MRHQHTHTHRHGRRGRGHRHGRRSGFGPWTFQGSFFERGELPLALLSLLTEAPMHGYELMKQLEARTNGVYEASAGSIYPTLQQLTDKDLVTATEAEGGKRLFELTDGGKRMLDDEAETVTRIWARAEDDEWTGWSDAMADDAAEITRPVFRLMRTAVKTIATSRDPERTEKVRDILNEARDRIRALRDEPTAG